MTAVDNKISTALVEFVARRRRWRSSVRRVAGDRTVSSSGTAQIHERVPVSRKSCRSICPSREEPTPRRDARGVHLRRRSRSGRRTRGTRRPPVRGHLRTARRHHDRDPHPHSVPRRVGAGASSTADQLTSPCSAPHWFGSCRSTSTGTQAEVDFILEQLERDADIPAIVEANGGATVWDAPD